MRICPDAQSAGKPSLLLNDCGKFALPVIIGAMCDITSAVVNARYGRQTGQCCMVVVYRLVVRSAARNLIALPPTKLCS